MKTPQDRRRDSRTSSLHHRHARQSLRRGGNAAADRTSRSQNHDARRTIKKDQPITVVIGNPPYKDKAEGRGGWIENGSPGARRRSIAGSRHRAWGVGAHAKHLKNLYVYFWRWATWKVFGSGLHAATGLEQTDKDGIVCFITVAGFLWGRLPEDARRSAPRLLRDLGDRLLAGRPSAGRADAHLSGRAAAGLHRARGPRARQGYKTASTRPLSRFAEGPARGQVRGAGKAVADGSEWVDCPTGWRAPFLPEQLALGRNSCDGGFVCLERVRCHFLGGLGSVAPDAQSLRDRWNRLIAESSGRRKNFFFLLCGMARSRIDIYKR